METSWLSSMADEKHILLSETSNVIDEKWIRERVHLKHDNLDDVKSLSLPGSYHEKITFLGTSLHSFTRLKHLDLSRNSVCSLEGIGHLHMLETLNLYYNNISTLRDLFHLRTLTNLKELDIRLNPVTKNEADHRLFLIHMLPSLRKLDDRSVRDKERKAALMHFNADQASEFTDERNDVYDEDFVTQNHSLNIPHAKLVKNIGTRSALDNDDIILIDSITHKQNSRKHRIPEVQDYGRRELDEMIDKEEKEDILTKARNLNKLKEEDVAKDLIVDINNNIKHCRPRLELYAPHPTHGHFTPTPQRYSQTTDLYDSKVAERSSQSTLTQDVVNQSRSDLDEIVSDGKHHVMRSRDTESLSSSVSNAGGNQPTPSNNSNELRLLHKLMDLVDKYWNGSRSLHNHVKFRELAVALLKSYGSSIEHPERDLTSLKKLREDLSTKEKELSQLSKTLTKQQHTNDELQRQLEREISKRQLNDETTKQLTRLHHRFEATQQENVSLKAALKELEEQKKSDDTSTEMQRLQDENIRFKERFEQQKENIQQLNDLATMLQESHRSLVATNDHLLVELSQEKDRHQSEVNQLHWSYKQLKKSVDWIPSIGKLN